jgi:hypothetical protein
LTERWINIVGRGLIHPYDALRELGASMNLPTAFIVVLMFIDTMGFGLIAPVAPGLIMQLSGIDLAAAAPGVTSINGGARN